MSDAEPTRFDQILKKANDDMQAFIGLMLILIIGTGVAVYTLLFDESTEFFSWAWKAALFFGLLIPFARHLWKTARFETKAYREAGAFMVEGQKGPVARDMPFGHLWHMRDIAWAEHLALKQVAPPPAMEGYLVVMLQEAPGEELLLHTRITCAGCGRALRPFLADDLWKEREAGRPADRVGEDLDAARHCKACGHPIGRFRTSLDGPVAEG